jgi:signal transduction histidine kinase
MTIRAKLQLHSLGVVAAVLAAIVVLNDRVAFRDVLLPGLAATAVALVAAEIIARSLSSRVRELRDVSVALVQGDLDARPPLSATGEFGELATAVHRLSEHLVSRIMALRAEDALLGALIESLDEGVVAIDARGLVVRINPAAREILGVTRSLSFSPDHFPRVRELQNAIESAFRGEITDPAEAIIGRRTVSLTARPLPMGGVVLALFDLTEIRRLETVRRDFVANVSHELRTPLTVIGGFAETLHEDDPPPELRRQFAATVKAQAQRMQRIVDDLLDLSRLESGSWEPKRAAVDVSAVTAEVMSVYAPVADEKGIELRAELGGVNGALQADPTAVRQVIANLVDNAVRHTAKGGVVVGARAADGGTWIDVRDTGQGISREHLPRIFERFYRADPGRARKTGGTGLGLAIVKHLVEAHGGHVSAASEHGQGTTISVFFPGEEESASD